MKLAILVLLISLLNFSFYTTIALNMKDQLVGLSIFALGAVTLATLLGLFHSLIKQLPGVDNEQRTEQAIEPDQGK